MSKQTLIDFVDKSIRDLYTGRDEVPTEPELRAKYVEFYDFFSQVQPDLELPSEGKDEAIQAALTAYLSELQITKKVGFAFVDKDTRRWLKDREDTIEWFYWNRYRNHLVRSMKWSPAAVSSLDDDTKEILDRMADPQGETGFERRGLVVASVQSGKTANYTGLIARAADAGYKIIIVLAGLSIDLRNQTQRRLEEGFTGRNISVDGLNWEVVGVGKDGTRFPVMCTSRLKDFDTTRADAFKGNHTNQVNEPMFFVIKKNCSVLKNLFEWLQSNTNRTDPLLLIDDEADNASINVNYDRKNPDEDPTRINGQIRQILTLFDRRCYVGYTATPFANILIDPDLNEDGEFGKDLFPESFIYTLEESTDYFGARKVFQDYDKPERKYLRSISDIDALIPPKHRKSLQITAIPESLKDAIRTFYIATTIRYLNGEVDNHSTMMVNASPYKDPQKAIKDKIVQYCTQLDDAIRAYGQMPPENAIQSSKALFALKQTWQQEYSTTTPYSWQQIQEALFQATHKIHVVTINSDTNNKLDYEAQTERVIAVGGYSLSRGLTLEGLTVSYYSRNAKAYDALMQMSRWFGYRPRYQDLCRIWMSDETAGWYKFISDTTDELFDELREMAKAQLTPLEYGLKIRHHPGSLIVTARNKQGTGEVVKARSDLDKGFVETIAFKRNEIDRKRNIDAASALLEAAERFRIENPPRGALFYHEVPVAMINEFLREYINDDDKSWKSQTTPVRKYITSRNADGELLTWDIVVIEGDSDTTIELAGVELKGERRSPGDRTNEESIVVGTSQRFGSPNDEMAGLEQKDIEIAKSEFRDAHPIAPGERRSYPGAIYRKKRKIPLLIIHPAVMAFESTDKIQEKPGRLEFWPADNKPLEALGWGISLPKSRYKPKLVDYIFNRTKLHEEFWEDSDNGTANN